MRNHRLVAGLAAALITLGGVLSVTAGDAPALPPPVTMRGPAGGGPATDPTSVGTDGLEVVPAPVIELGSTTSAPAAGSAESPDDPTTTTASVVPPDTATAASPDVADQDSVASADSADSADD